MTQTKRSIVLPDPAVATTIRQSTVARLLESPNPAQRRQGHDLQQLLDLQDGPWRGRFAILQVGPGPRDAMAVRVRLAVDGLLYDGGPRQQSVFDLVLLVSPNYPLSSPIAVFTGGPIPFHGNVFHADFAPDRRGMPPELQQILRDGCAGFCCYGLASQWSPRLDHNLATVLRQISRLLVGAKIHGEEYALNPKARDHYLELREGGRLPLGPALPLPCDDPQAQDGVPDDRPETEAIAWREE